MKKIITAAAATLVTGMLVGASPASAANFNNLFGPNSTASNSMVVQVKSNGEQFGARGFKRHFDGSARPTIRNRNKRRFGNRRSFNSECVRPRRIHRRLVRQGWSDFHNLRIRRQNIRVKAYRNNGLLYNIKVHRCSGHIVSTQLDWSSFSNVANYFGHWNSFKQTARR